MGKPFSECTIPELEGKAKSLKTVITIVLVVMILFLAYLIYKISNGGEFEAALFVAPMACMICAMLPAMASLGKIKKEIEGRSESKGNDES